MLNKFFLSFFLMLALVSSTAFGQASGQPKKNEPSLVQLKLKAESALEALQGKDQKLVGYIADLRSQLATAKKQDKMSEAERQRLNGSMGIVSLSSFETLRTEKDFRLTFQEALNAFHGSGKELEAFAEWAAIVNLKIPPSREKEVEMLSQEAQKLLLR